MSDNNFELKSYTLNSIAGKQTGMSTFVTKLYEMVQGQDNHEIISWVLDGTAFEIKDPKRLEGEILPKFFRHSRFQSLIRQLNFYAFKKVSRERSSWIYSHEHFQLKRPELLEKLRRKTNNSGDKRIISDSISQISSPKKRCRSNSSEEETDHGQESSDQGETNKEFDEDSYDEMEPFSNQTSGRIHECDIQDTGGIGNPLTDNWMDAHKYFDSSECRRRSTSTFGDDSTFDSSFILSSEIDAMRGKLKAISSTNLSVSSGNVLENTVVFCLQRNPWLHSQSLFDEVYQLLLRHLDLVHELNDYCEALAPSNLGTTYGGFSGDVSSAAGTLAEGDCDSESCSTSSSSQHHSSRNPSWLLSPNREHILHANELTIMRTFMVFSATALQAVYQNMTSDLPDSPLSDDPLTSKLHACAQAWWDYAKVYI